MKFDSKKFSQTKLFEEKIKFCTKTKNPIQHQNNFINFFFLNSYFQNVIFINQELVARGLAEWVEESQMAE